MPKYLTEKQKLEFKRDGFIIIRQIIPNKLIISALKTINTKLGESASSCYSDLGEFRPDTQCHHQDIVNLLYKSPLFEILNELFGHGKVGKPVSAQVALKFPSTCSSNEKWHIDGNGELLPFNLLAGISLSDQQSGGGCLFGYPGSHFKVQENFSKLEQLKLKSPFEIILNAGDIVLMHQMTAHFVGSNLLHQIRYQVYFRIWHQDLENHRKEGLQDLFRFFKDLSNKSKK